MISPPLSGVMEDCSIVRVQQLQMLYRRRCCMSASQHMFGSLWNVAVAHEHRRQDGTCRVDMMAKCQTATGVASSIVSTVVWPLWSVWTRNWTDFRHVFQWPCFFFPWKSYIHTSMTVIGEWVLSSCRRVFCRWKRLARTSHICRRRSNANSWHWSWNHCSHHSPRKRLNGTRVSVHSVVYSWSSASVFDWL